MKLVRTAVLTFRTASPQWRELTLFKVGVVKVRAMPCCDEAGTLTLAVAAEIPLAELPQVTDDNRVEIPTAARHRGERAIESVANLIAVTENCSRVISASHPCVAFLPTNSRERHWLNQRAGMAVPLIIKAIPRVGPRVPRRLLRRFDDRRRGVALLAEALAHGHTTGKFHELVRFFEHAFARPYNKLEKKLWQCLVGSGLGYTRAEVQGWLHEIRDPATHADERLDFALEATTRPVVNRMEQAAYDVLLNKKVWHDPSSERRRTWSPDWATTDDQGAAMIRRGCTQPLGAQLLDTFGSYPLYLKGGLVFPEGAWLGDMTLGRVKSAPFPVTIVPARRSKRRTQPPAKERNHG